VLLVTEAGSGAEPQKISNLVQFLKSDIRWQQLTMLLKINRPDFEIYERSLFENIFTPKGLYQNTAVPSF